MKSLSQVQPFGTPWTVTYQAPLPMGFSRQEYWSGVPLPSPQRRTQFSSVQFLSRVQLFATHESQHTRPPCPSPTPSLLKLMSIESVTPSIYLILCRPLLLLSSIFPIIRVFSNESRLHIRYPKYWSFSFSISPSNENSGLVCFRID